MTEPIQITIGGTDYTVFRREIEQLSLEKTDVYPQMRLKPNGENPYVGMGILIEFDSIPEYKTFTYCPPRILCAQDFFPYERKTAAWSDFPSHLFFLPEIEILPDGQTFQYSLLETFRDIPVCEYEEEATPAKFQGTKPGIETYKTKVASFIESIKKNALDKIVFARTSEWTFKKHVPLLSLLHHLDQAKNCFSFCLRISCTEAFVGATPETLFSTSGKRLSTEAIAGTRKRGISDEEDQHYEEELLKSAKDSIEFEHVYKAISSILEEITVAHEVSSTISIVKTSTAQHLKTNLHGVIAPQTPLSKIVKKLHPTPAVGGKPIKKVLPLLYQSEPFDRGYYAAPLGYILPKSSHFVVAIRSALINENTLTLFAGTGLVADSDPQEEWDELNTKTDYFTQWIHTQNHSNTPSLGTL